MKKSYFLVYMLAVALISFSCTGVKNMSGTLSKSDDKNSTSRTRYGDYSGTTRADSLNQDRSTGYHQTETNTGRAWESKNTDTYRKNYDRASDNQSDKLGVNGGLASSSVQDYNQKLVNQYQEMDKLGDVILYEIDIQDRHYASLLEDYKTANNNTDREAISRELDKLSANQISLYRAYTKIYKTGKTDWPRVKNEVENTLLTLRGFDKK